jgi:hypothetical protein
MTLSSEIASHGDARHTNISVAIALVNMPVGPPISVAALNPCIKCSVVDVVINGEIVSTSRHVHKEKDGREFAIRMLRAYNIRHPKSTAHTAYYRKWAASGRMVNVQNVRGESLGKRGRVKISVYWYGEVRE